MRKTEPTCVSTEGVTQYIPTLRKDCIEDVFICVKHPRAEPHLSNRHVHEKPRKRTKNIASTM